MNELFLIAKVVSVYGKEGFVKILSYTDFPERFFNLKKVYLDFFDDKKEFLVEEVKKQKNSFLLKFKNFNTVSEAEILIGKEIFVDKKNLVELPKDHFFIHDLIGSKVFRNNVELGVIKDVLKYPANDVYVVENLGKEILIPAAFVFIDSFDPENKILVLKPGDALYDDED